MRLCLDGSACSPFKRGEAAEAEDADVDHRRRR